MLNDRLQSGDTLNQDIFLNSSIPFLKKGTVLDEEHITMLQLFFLLDNESAAPVDTSEKEQNHQPSALIKNLR